MRFYHLLLCLFLSSCAKFSYMSEQAIGQIALEWNGVDNDELLEDPNVSAEIKNKITLVQEAKKFFYEYFDLESTPIYDETTILDQEAVTYLVIHSRIDKIEALTVDIPFVGEFPYLGFFDKNSAIEFANEKKEEGFSTYIRPVYAYSTLNHPMIPFHDNILSSFFRYKDEDLVSTIFHELVHTVVFIDNQVQFNENLAQFISDKLMDIYYTKIPNYGDLQKIKVLKQNKVTRKIIDLSKELNQNYADLEAKDQRKSEYQRILNLFLDNRFIPEMKTLCKSIEWEKNCWPLKGQWNNARFAALKTYESSRGDIEQAFETSNLNLKDFLKVIIKLEKNYSGTGSFLDLLSSKDK